MLEFARHMMDFSTAQSRLIFFLQKNHPFHFKMQHPAETCRQQIRTIWAPSILSRRFHQSTTKFGLAKKRPPRVICIYRLVATEAVPAAAQLILSAPSRLPSHFCVSDTTPFGEKYLDAIRGIAENAAPEPRGAMVESIASAHCRH
jgi:hypothetical protein